MTGVSKTSDNTSKGPRAEVTKTNRNARPFNIAFFGHDSNESTIRKRVRAFEAAGSKVTGFMFSRGRSGPVSAPAWENVELGLTEDGYFGRRLVQLFRALIILWSQRRLLRSADVFYARNIDMLLVARVAKAMVRSDAPLVYEALDVHPAMTKSNVTGSILRFAERRLLSASALLVVSSPRFIEQYFSPTQKYAGEWFLLENKIFSGDANFTEMPPTAAAVGPPWTIGWFGVIRCRRSLDILKTIAASMPDRVIVHIRGIPSERDGITKELLDEAARELRNLFYFGVYQSPRDLPEIYNAIDLTWAVDFSANGANSDWLIPNRLYEGGLYGIPAIARRSTATGDIVEQDSRGWCFDEPFEDNVANFLKLLDGLRYAETASRLRKKDRSAFVDVSDTARLVSKLEEIAHPASSPRRTSTEIELNLEQ